MTGSGIFLRSLAENSEDRAVVRGLVPTFVIDDFGSGEIHVAAECAVHHDEVDARVDVVRSPVVSPCVLLGIFGGNGG